MLSERPRISKFSSPCADVDADAQASWQGSKAHRHRSYIRQSISDIVGRMQTAVVSKVAVARGPMRPVAVAMPKSGVAASKVRGLDLMCTMRYISQAAAYG